MKYYEIIVIYGKMESYYVMFLQLKGAGSMIIDFIKNSWTDLLLVVVFLFVGLIGIRACLVEKIRKLCRCNVKVKGTIKSIKKEWIYVRKRKRSIYKPTCTTSKCNE